jgi:hypothetical protein
MPVHLVTLGPTITDEHGRRRLDNPDDFVRLEIEAALTRGVRVIPVLVNGAGMPGVNDLPLGMQGLARRQAVELSPYRFDTSVLIRVLAATVSGPPAPVPPVHRPSPPAAQRPPASARHDIPEADATPGAPQDDDIFTRAAEALSQAPPEQAARSLEKVNPVNAGGVLAAIELMGFQSRWILARMDPRKAAAILSAIDPKPAAMLLSRLVEDRQNYEQLDQIEDAIEPAVLKAIRNAAGIK